MPKKRYTPEEIVAKLRQVVGALSGGKSALSTGGSLGAPMTDFQYDFNILPLGQQLWEMQLMSYKTFPPLQAPETYNLDGILKQMQAARHPGD